MDRCRVDGKEVKIDWGATGERLGTQRTQNPYTAELQAVVAALSYVNDKIPPNSVILMVSANLTILQIPSNPERQSGQCAMRLIYNIKRDMEQIGIKLQWK